MQTVFCLLTLAITASAQEMLPSDSLSALRLSGPATREYISVEEMPFSRALRITVAEAQRNAWDVQILATTSTDVRQGDVLWMSLWARGSSMAESGEAIGTAYLQRRGGDYAKVVTLPFSGASNWRQFMIPVSSLYSLPAGQHEVAIHIGYQAQTLEIGGVELINYRDTRSLSDLPRTKLDWAGSEPDAPWRAIAEEKIEAIRKADLLVKVRDSAGNPVPGAAVRVRMKRHEFGFGSAVAADGIFSQAAGGDQYREVIRTWFNKVVLENDLKWPNWERSPEKALNALAWLRDNGNPQVRGHTLVWPGFRYLPADLPALASDPQKLRKRIMDHIAGELNATRGQLAEWDVLNEPWTNTDLQKVLGDDEMAEWFRKAREHEPSALLYINDYSILSNGGNDRAHQDGYYKIIQRLIELETPLDGIGMQGHFGAQLTAPVRIWQILDRFAQFGRRIQVTEFDINVDDEDAQGRYTRDFLTAIFAHPSIDGFMMWGFWEGRHWLPKGAMFRRDWSRKPNADAFFDLVFVKWWTDERGVTNSDGNLSVRGFKGQYEIEVTSGERIVTAPATLTGSGSEVTVVVP